MHSDRRGSRPQPRSFGQLFVIISLVGIAGYCFFLYNGAQKRLRRTEQSLAIAHQSKSSLHKEMASVRLVFAQQMDKEKAMKDELAKKLEEVQMDSKKSIRDVQQQNKELLSQHEELKKQHVQLEEKSNEVLQKHDALLREHEAVKKELGTHKQRSQEMEEKAKNQEETIARKDSEIQQLQDKMKSAKQQAEAAEQELQIVKKQNQPRQGMQPAENDIEGFSDQQGRLRHHKPDRRRHPKYYRHSQQWTRRSQQGEHSEDQANAFESGQEANDVFTPLHNTSHAPNRPTDGEDSPKVNGSSSQNIGRNNSFVERSVGRHSEHTTNLSRQLSGNRAGEDVVRTLQSEQSNKTLNESGASQVDGLTRDRSAFPQRGAPYQPQKSDQRLHNTVEDQSQPSREQAPSINQPEEAETNRQDRTGQKQEQSPPNKKESADQVQTGGGKPTDQSQTSEKKRTDQGKHREKESTGQGKTGGKESADQGKTSQKKSADQGKTSDKESADQGKTSDKELADQDKTSEKESADQGKTSEKESPDQGKTSEKESADQGKTSEKESADQGKASEKESADQGKTSEKESADQGKTSEKESADQDKSSKESTDQVQNVKDGDDQSQGDKDKGQQGSEMNSESTAKGHLSEDDIKQGQDDDVKFKNDSEKPKPPVEGPQSENSKEENLANNEPSKSDTREGAPKSRVLDDGQTSKQDMARSDADGRQLNDQQQSAESHQSAEQQHHDGAPSHLVEKVGEGSQNARDKVEQGGDDDEQEEEDRKGSERHAGNVDRGDGHRQQASNDGEVSDGGGNDADQEDSDQKPKEPVEPHGIDKRSADDDKESAV